MEKQKVPVKIVKALIVPVLFFLLWEICGRLGKMNVSILTMPSLIVESWIELIQNGKYRIYLSVSFLRFLKGFSFGSLLGLILGTVMGLSKRISAYFNASASLLRSIPLIAWVPIVILTMGVGEKSRAILVAIGCFWSVFLNTMDGMKSVNYRYLEVAEVLEKSRMEIITQVVFPAAFPSIVTGLRAGFSNSWRSIAAAEMIGASSGIGFIITYGRESSRPDLMYVGLVSVAVIGLILDIILVHIQDRMLQRYNQR